MFCECTSAQVVTATPYQGKSSRGNALVPVQRLVGASATGEDLAVMRRPECWSTVDRLAGGVVGRQVGWVEYLHQRMHMEII